MTVNNHLFRRSSRARWLSRKSLLPARVPKRPILVMQYAKAKQSQRHLVGYPALDEETSARSLMDWTEEGEVDAWTEEVKLMPYGCDRYHEIA